MSGTQPSHSLAVVQLIAAAVLWSTSGAFIKLVDWTPMPIAGVRSAIAAIVLVMVIRRPHFTWSRAQVGGALAYACSVTLFVAAMKWTSVANAIVLQYTAPIHVALLGAWLLDERTTGLDWLSIAITMAGVAMFFVEALSPGALLGNLTALASGFAFACLIIALRSQRHGSPFESILLGNLLAAAISLPFWSHPAPDAVGWLVLVFLGVFQLGVAHVLYASALRHVRALEAALVPMIEPILSPLWALLVIGERPGPFAIAGGCLVLGTVAARGVVMAIRDGKGS
jgi:drug/metabolite transporter (DMT)-like permease